MNLFTKIYSVVLVLFIAVISFVSLQLSTSRIAEIDKMLIENHRLTGSLVASEVKRWQAEGKWPFDALRNLTVHDDFLFWWIADDKNIIYLADENKYENVKY
jgi:hypothetical protein